MGADVFYLLAQCPTGCGQLDGKPEGKEKQDRENCISVSGEDVSYTYWHQAIVEEGLLKGDQYQFISLHENILFSYFEEPKNMVNITGMEKASEVIDKWLAVNPESILTGRRRAAVIL